uniref:CARMIL C-terminal domain-containing protein n=1 Tax=Gadus morhua TaxID=8049 RepID=A0A8C5AAR7_GADMO
MAYRSVTWDRNNTSATGFLDVARALEHNFTLQYMPLPLSDISQAYRSAPGKTEQALTKIQRALLRNNQTQQFSQRQALRLHQGLVTSTAEQVMERLCVRVEQQVCVLRGVGDMEEIQAAKQVLKEARSSRALYPSLCELAHVLSVDGPVRQRLDSLAGELAKAADKELQVIVDSMVSLCRELCPLSSSSAERLTPPLSSVSDRVSIPRSAIRTALMERAAQDIHRALEEVKLSVVSYLTNSIVDQILQELYATHKALTQQVSQLKRLDGTCEDGTGQRSHRNSLEITDEELGTSIDTIAIKKRSSRTRRIRPVSTRLSLCDDSSSTPPTSMPSFSSPLSRSASWEGLSELPTQGAPLLHVTRVRPKPPRRHRASHLPPDTHCSENGGDSPLDDGLPDFYSKRVLPDSQLSFLHKSNSLRRKKRSNMLSIFSFRKNRNQTLDPEPESGEELFSEECHAVAIAPTGTAMENVYTLLQPPRTQSRAESPGVSTDRRGDGPQWEKFLVLSPPPVQGIPHTSMGGIKHPFYSPKEVCPGQPLILEGVPKGGSALLRTWLMVAIENCIISALLCFGQKSILDTELQQPEYGRLWGDVKQSDRLKTMEGSGHAEGPRQPDGRQGDGHAEAATDGPLCGQQQLDGERERTRAESKPKERACYDSRRADKQWTLDRHAQRQIDRKLERQWTTGRHLDRSWSENRSTDIAIDWMWTERRQPGSSGRKTERPLPPYTSDWTPSTKQEGDPLRNLDLAALVVGERTLLHMQETPSDRRSQSEGWRSGGGGVSSSRSAPCASKPDPPLQSSKRHLHRLSSERTIHGFKICVCFPFSFQRLTIIKNRPDSYSNYYLVHVCSGDEGIRPQAPVKPRRHRKAMSCDTGTDRDRDNLEKPTNRKPPVKKPRLPQNRNKSLDLRWLNALPLSAV